MNTDIAALDQEISTVEDTILTQQQELSGLLEKRLIERLRAWRGEGGILRTAETTDIDGTDVTINEVQDSAGNDLEPAADHDGDTAVEGLFGVALHEQILDELRALRELRAVNFMWKYGLQEFVF